MKMFKHTRRNLVAGLLVALVLLGASPVVHAILSNLGPLDPSGGFPMWYEDPNGVKLDPCIDARFCASLPVVPGNAQSAATGFGLEGFYYLINGKIGPTTPGVKVTYAQSLEATYALGAVPKKGQRTVFQRLVVKLAGIPTPGNYILDYPYGTLNFTAADFAADPPPATTFHLKRFDQRIPAGGVALNFRGAMQGPVGPWVSQVRQPVGFIGNINVNAASTAITGSPVGQNFIRLTGPPGVDLGGPVTKINVITTRLFQVQGHLATRIGATINSALYSRTIAGRGFVLVTATSNNAEHIVANTPGGVPVDLVEDVNLPGTYKGKVRFPKGAAFSPVTVTNLTDVPASSFTKAAVDRVVITSATYTAATTTLTVNAVSGDLFVPPALTVIRTSDGVVLGSFTGGTFTLTNLLTNPVNITVTSTAGGSASRRVVLN